MNPDEIHRILQAHVPVPAVDYCFHLWQEAPFFLKITRARQTKLGDFTSRHSRAQPRITLNFNLNPYLFLTTYIHEVAHWRTYRIYGNRVDPHGEEWRTMFTRLMEPVLWEEIFPESVLHVLRRHMINPKASSYADGELTEAFRKFDPGAERQLILRDLPDGTVFQFQGRYFKREQLRRTRVLCLDMQNRKRYLVPMDAVVSYAQLPLW